MRKKNTSGIFDSKVEIFRAKFWNSFPSLKIKNFRYFWTGQLVSLTGTWMQTAAQSWLVLTITDSPLLLGLLGVAQFTPVLFFSLFAGVYIDRFPKKTIIFITQALSMVLAFLLAALVLFEVVNYWQVFFISLALGFIKTVDIPARQAYMTELVGKEHLLNAIALNSMVFNLARIVGPSLGGITIVLFGVGWCFLLNALSFIAVLIGIYKIDAEPLLRQKPKTSIVPEIKDGLLFVFKKEELFKPLLILLIMNVFAMNFSVLIPVFAKDHLGKGAAEYGLLMSALGLGSVVGAIFIAMSSKKRPSQLRLLVVPFLTGFLFFAMGFVDSYLVACILITLMGFFNIFFTTTANSTLQINSSDEYRGRVMSIYSLVFAGTTPIGNAFVGAVSDSFNSPLAFLSSGILTVSLVGLILIVLKIRSKG